MDDVTRLSGEDAPEPPAQDPVPPASPASSPVPPHEPPLVSAGDPIGMPTSDLPEAPPAESKRSGCASGCVTTLISVVLAGLVGFTAGLAGAYLYSKDDQPRSTPTTINLVGDETPDPVTAVAVVAVPSVVNIDTTGASVTSDDSELPEGHPGVPVAGNGSGVAFLEAPEDQTYLLTNEHVVSGADRIVVTDSRGDRYDGQVVGTDVNTDIAVVLVDAVIPLIDIGDSDDVAVGNLAVAIGSPFGLQQSVTAGVVSAIGRSLIEPTGRPGVYPLVDVIQTDAAINPGNSGGALVDRQGNLIGINTAIFSGSGTNGGIGFAVPVNTAIRVADEIIATGSAEAPFIGISGQTVSEQLAEAEGLATDEGALVVELIEGTKALESELQPGDVIVSYEGDPIRSMDDLILAVRQSVVGDEAVLEVYRGEDLMEITIVVGPKPEAL